MPTSNKLTKKDLNDDGEVPVFSSISSNNGIIGFTLREPDYFANKDDSIHVIFGDHTRSFNITKENFSVMDNVKVLKPIMDLTLNQTLFITSAWKKNIKDKGYSRHWSIAKNSKILLPVKNNKVDFDFMESFVAELEAQRVAELEAYLTVTGLKDYELTEDEERALELLANDKIEWIELKVKEVFEVNSYKKRFDANKVEILESGHPYVVRMGTNNGVRGYLDEDEEFLNNGNTISFGQDTATMFYQPIPYFTGDKIKILESKFDWFDKKTALFFISTMSKSFSDFSWGARSFSVETINNQNIELPLNSNGEIDFEFMKKIILAISKLVIKDVVIWSDKKIEATKQVISK